MKKDLGNLVPLKTRTFVLKQLGYFLPIPICDTEKTKARSLAQISTGIRDSHFVMGRPIYSEYKVRKKTGTSRVVSALRHARTLEIQ